MTHYNGYQAHEACDMFPELIGSDFNATVESIRFFGLLVAILLDPTGKKIIDGRARYKACLLLGIEPRFEIWNGQGSIVDLIFTLNFHRRHLNESQRAMAAAKQKKYKKAEQKTIALAAKSGDKEAQMKLEVVKAPANQELSQQFNVGTRTIESAIAVLKKGVPELIEKVETGELAAFTAELLAALPAKEQIEILKKGDDAVVKKVARYNHDVKVAAKKEQKRLENAERIRNLRPLPERYKVFTHDIRKPCDTIEPNSLDWVVTDPLYQSTEVELFDDLGRFALTYLKDGGSLIMLVDQCHLNDHFRRLDNSGLRYNWFAVWDMVDRYGVKINFNRRGVPDIKPIICYVKGVYNGEIFSRSKIAAPYEQGAKDFHEYGQSVQGFENLMKPIVRPNDLVCDPFMGSGTTGLAAMKLNCRFIGMDIEQRWVDVSQSRINNLIDEMQSPQSSEPEKGDTEDMPQAA